MENSNVNVVSENSSRRNSERRRVSFPDTELVSYAEPLNPFNTVQNVTIEEIKTAYMMSCAKYEISPIESTLKQIAKFSLVEGEREEMMELNKVDLTLAVCDSLEEIFRRVQFKEVEVTECSIGSEAAMALFEMLNFYDSGLRFKLNLTSPLDHDCWTALSQYLLRSEELVRFEMYGMTLQESDSLAFINSLWLNYHLENLILRNIDFVQSLPMSYLAYYLPYGVIQQLELSACGLEASDVEELCVGLRDSRFLSVLQLGHNNIGDRGACCLLRCLAERQWPLTVLVLCDNGLTQRTAPHLAALLLANEQRITLLNLSHNPLRDEAVLAMEDGVSQSRTMRGLGLQRCGLTDAGLEVLARVLRRSPHLRRLDLRGNHATLAGWQAFCAGFLLTESPALIDLDPEPLDETVPLSSYRSLVEAIGAKTRENRLLRKEVLDERRVPPVARKISLTCHTLPPRPAPVSPPPPPATPPPASGSGGGRKPKSRFHITPVSDARYAPTSRFVVSSVQDVPGPSPPQPMELTQQTEDMVGRLASKNCDMELGDVTTEQADVAMSEHGHS